MAKRLHIVVPYRAREAHLRVFLPHISFYFARDKADRHIDYRLSIIEQEPGLPFNMGALKNIGFLLGEKETDYTCFHDVDYLPVWADYSWAEVPTALVWYGAEARPLAPGRSNLVLQHKLDEFVGGAFLVPNKLFRRVDGCAGDYWGWGFEDLDLIRRFAAANIPCSRRKGTFTPLDHDSNGFDADGVIKPEARANHTLFHRRWSASAEKIDDGLSNLSYQILLREPVTPTSVPERRAEYERVLISLAPRPAA